MDRCDNLCRVSPFSIFWGSARLCLWARTPGVRKVSRAGGWKGDLFHLACTPSGANGWLQGDPGNITFALWASASSFEQREERWISLLSALTF